MKRFLQLINIELDDDYAEMLFKVMQIFGSKLPSYFMIKSNANFNLHYFLCTHASLMKVWILK